VFSFVLSRFDFEFTLEKNLCNFLVLNRYGDNPNLCSNISSCHLTKKKSMLAVYVVAPLAVVVIIGFVLVLLVAIRKKQGEAGRLSVTLFI
jgi:hypothetical protein